MAISGYPSVFDDLQNGHVADLWKLVAKTQRTLAESESITRHDFSILLGAIGRVAGLSAIRILHRQDSGLQQEAQWSRSISDNAPNADFWVAFDTAARPYLVARKCFWIDQESAPHSLGTLMERVSVLSLGCVPIVNRGVDHGLVVFEDDQKIREWRPDQTDALSVVGDLIARALIDRIEPGGLLSHASPQLQAGRLTGPDRIGVANALLHDNLISLPEGADLDQVLGRILVLIVEQLGEKDGGVWIHDPVGMRNRLYLTAENGVVSRSEKSSHPAKGIDPSTQEYTAYLRRLAQFQQNEILIHRQLDFETLEDYAPYKDYLKAEGIRAIVSVPVFAGPELLAVISVRARRRDSFSDDELGFVLSLAKQASLALHIAKLGSEAQEAAIAREKFATLQRANMALEKSAKKLATAETLETFLGETLATLIDSFGASGGSFWNWHVDRPVLALELQDGEFTPLGTSDHPARFGKALSEHSDVPRSWEERILAGDAVVLDVGADFDFDPPQREYLVAQGIRLLIVLPLNLGDRPIGRFVLRLPKARFIAEHEIELAMTLAMQAALVMGMATLGEQAKKAAIELERETAARRHAEKMANAYFVLRRSAEQLGSVDDIAPFLGSVLLTITNVLDAKSSSVWEEEEATGLTHLRFVVEDGRLLPASESSHQNATTPYDNAQYPVMEGSGTSSVHVTVTHLDDLNESPETIGYLRELGVKCLIAVPMVVDGKQLGSFTIRRSESKAIADEDLELIRALANQAAVALHLIQLSRQARHAALFQERALAARERVEKLSEAHRLLRVCAERLVTFDDIDPFLGHVLLCMTQLLGANSSTVWVEDKDAGMVHLRYVVEDGRAIPADQSTHPNAQHPHAIPPPDHDAVTNRGTSRASMGIVLVEAMDSPQSTIDYLHSLGVKAILAVPMLVNDHHLGTFTIRLTDSVSIDAEDGELIQALGNQAAVALYLTMLSQQAKEAAVSKAQAQQLSRANAALSQSLHFFASEIDLPSFLNHQIMVIADLMKAANVDLWLLDNKNKKIGLRAKVKHGALQDLSLAPVFDGARSHTPVDKLFGLHRESIGPVSFSANEGDIIDVHYDLSSHVSKNAPISLGNISLPLGVGHEIVGLFICQLRDGIALTSDTLELSQALVNQTVLAVRLSELAVTDREAAVAAEREAAARQRAEKLAASNQILRASAERLGPVGDIDEFLGEVLLTLTKVIDAVSATVWIYEPEFNRSRLAYVVEQGKLVPAPLSAHPNSLYQFPFDKSTYRDATGGLFKPFRLYVDTDPHLRDTERRYLQDLGVSSLLSVPIVLSGNYLGSFSIRLHHNDPLLDEDIEVVQGLANQTAVALHLAHVADENKRAALAVERERAAEERAAKLATANAVLKASMDSLTGPDRLEGFLGTVLLSIVSCAKGESGSVFLFDLEARTSTLAFVVENGLVIRGADSKHPNALGPTPMSAEGHGIFNMLASGSPAIYRADDPLLAPEQVRYFADAGTKALLAVPMILKNELIGVLNVRLLEAVSLPSEDLELMRALGNHATLALQLHRLNEQAKRATFAAAREQLAIERAERIARSSRVLQETVESLVGADSLDIFLGKVLQAITQQMSATSATFWIFESEQSGNRLELIYENSEVKRPSATNHPNATGVAYVPGELIRAAEELGRPQLWNLADESIPLSSEQRAYFEKLEVKAVLDVPVCIQNQYLGSFVVRLAEFIEVSAEDSALVQALANQTAMALQLSHMAVRAREAAVAQEKEQAARARARELTSANQSLRNSIERLTSLGELSSFTGSLLLSMTSSVNAIGSAIFLCDPERTVSELYVATEDGQVVDVQADERFVPFRLPNPIDVDRAVTWTRVADSNPFWLARIDDPELHPGVASWHLAQGHQQVVHIPLRLGELLVGFLALAFSNLEEPSALSLDIVCVLAQQFTIALQLSRLGETARKTAILQEKEKAAHERAVELADANAALRGSLDLLAQQPDIDNALRHILEIVAMQLGSSLAALVVCRSGEDLICHSIYRGQDNTEARPDESALTFDLFERIAHELDALPPRLRTLVLREHDAKANTVKHPNSEYEAHYLGVPLILENAALGWFIMRISALSPPADSKLELAQTLAHQATLALQLQSLSTRAAYQAHNAATLEERNRIARDIHDTLAQGLTGIIAQLNAGKVVDDAALKAKHIDLAIQTARTSLIDARRSVYALRSEDAERGNLMATLESSLKCALAASPVAYSLTTEGRYRDLAEGVANELARIVQESTTNIVRHANATQIKVLLRFADIATELVIEDDGVGFTVRGSTQEGFGLLGMRERAARVGGSFRISSKPGAGTKIEVTVPNVPK